MKKIFSILLTISLIMVTANTAFAVSATENDNFTVRRSIETSETISGSESSRNSLLRSYEEKLGTCATWVEIDKKFLSDKWRAEGHCSITPLNPYDPITWDITLDVQLWRYGHNVIGANATGYQRSSYALATDWVEGINEGDFGAVSRCTVQDDNKITIWDITDYTGNPF